MSYISRSFASSARTASGQASAPQTSGAMRVGVMQRVEAAGSATLGRQAPPSSWSGAGSTLAQRVTGPSSSSTLDVPAVQRDAAALGQRTLSAADSSASSAAGIPSDSEPTQSAASAESNEWIACPMRGRGTGRGGVASPRGRGGFGRGMRGRGGSLRLSAPRASTSVARDDSSSEDEGSANDTQTRVDGGGRGEGRGLACGRGAPRGRGLSLRARGTFSAGLRGRGGSHAVRAEASFSDSSSAEGPASPRSSSPISSEDSSAEDEGRVSYRVRGRGRGGRGACGLTRRSIYARGMALAAEDDQEEESSPPALSREESQRISPKTPEDYLAGLGNPVRSWKSLHADDIHGFSLAKWREKSGFLTGSKDGEVRFTFTASGVSHLLAIGEKPYCRSWITALAVHGTGLLAIGRRSGSLSLLDWDSAEVIASTVMERPAGRVVAVQERVHSLSWVSPVGEESFEPRLLVGIKGRFERRNKDLKTETVFETSFSGVCYGAAELSPGRLVTIEGRGLSIRVYEEDKWRYESLLRAQLHGKGSLAAHQPDLRLGGDTEQKTISYVQNVPDEAGKVVIAQFDGSVSMIDCEGPRLGAVTTVREASLWALSDYDHFGNYSRRVWQTVPQSPHVWICATDDGTLPVVDFRAQAIVKRLAPGGSRVSGLALSEDRATLYAASCACKPDLSEGGGVHAYDLRS